MNETKKELDLELEAISILMATLEPLTETSRSSVLDFVFRKLNIASPVVPQPELTGLPQPSVAGSAANGAPTTASRLPADIYSLKEEKQPNSVNEMVALVAYYLAHVALAGEQRDYIVAEDIPKYFNQARFRLPEGPARMALTNAKNAGYLEAKERGQYRLSAVGHNLVVHRLGASGEARAPARKKRKGKAPRRGQRARR